MAWAVNEFLDTREEHTRSKSKGIDGNVGWAAVNLFDDNQGQRVVQGASQKTPLWIVMTMTRNSVSTNPTLPPCYHSTLPQNPEMSGLSFSHPFSKYSQIRNSVVVLKNKVLFLTHMNLGS